MKSNKRRSVQKALTKIVMVSGLCLAPVMAQANALGLIDVYRLALSHDAKLAQAQAQYQADIKSIDTAKGALLPQIQADGSYFVTDSSYDRNDVTSRDLSITFNQSIYEHANWARYDQAKYQVEQALSKYQNAQQNLILRVTKSYLDVLLAKQNLYLSKTKEAADYTQYETAQASAELGLSSKVDVLQAKSSYDLSKSETINAENGLDIAFETLSKITGETIINLQKRGLKQLSPQVVLPKTNLNRVELEKRSEIQNLTVKQQQAQLVIANKEVEVQRDGYYPSVSFQAKYTDSAYSNSGAGSLLADNNKTSVGVNLSMPLYSGGRTQSQVSAAKYQIIAAQQALRDSQETAKLNVRTEVRNLERGAKLVLALREAVKSNDAFLESAQEGYKVGIKSMLEVLTARTNQMSAHKNLIEAIHNQIINRFNLEANLGDLTFEDIQVYDPLLQTFEGNQKK